MKELFNENSFMCSALVTKNYSTSFSMGIKLFSKEYRNPIYAIYGFVRFADEIVDTFHDFDKKSLLLAFKNDTFESIESGISLNPILHAFQIVVNKYNIDLELVEAFLYSMEMDLNNQHYDDKKYQQYIYGSAEVVGLMCLQVFCDGNSEKYNSLKDNARSLGAAFQKINFLRDIKSDFEDRGRVYFPGVDMSIFDNHQKTLIENDIKKDFQHGYEGIKKLPKPVRLGVYLAYIYYLNLFDKIKNLNANKVKMERIRVTDRKKIVLLFSSVIKNQFDII
jgi:15-cis-phytoene synthase